MTVKFEDIKDKLVPLDTLRKVFKPTEGLEHFDFSTDGSDDIKFTFPDGWDEALKELTGTDQSPVGIAVNGEPRHLSKNAVLQAINSMGLTEKYAKKCPVDMLEPQMNYWYTHSGTPHKHTRLLATDTLGQAFINQASDPFSNEEVLDNVLTGIDDVYGAGASERVMADYKYHHSLPLTRVRLIIPDHVRKITDDDLWSAGITFQNSVIGDVHSPLQVEGYLFRYLCTNGMSTLHSNADRMRRTKSTTADDGYNWARDTVNSVLAKLEKEFDAVESLKDVELAGDLGDQFNDVFDRFKIPLGSRQEVLNIAIDNGDTSAYGILNAVTQAANSPDVSELTRGKLLEAGGRVSHLYSAGGCPTCHKL